MHQLHLIHYQIQSGSRSCASSVCSCVRSGLVRHHDTLCKCSWWSVHSKTHNARYGKPCSQYYRLIFGTGQIFPDMYQATSPFASIEEAVREPTPIVLFFCREYTGWDVWLSSMHETHDMGCTFRASVNKDTEKLCLWPLPSITAKGKLIILLSRPIYFKLHELYPREIYSRVSRTKLKIPRKDVCTSYLSRFRLGSHDATTPCMCTHTAARRYPSHWY